MINRTTSVLTQEVSHQPAVPLAPPIPLALGLAVPHMQHGAAGGAAMGNIQQARNRGPHHAILVDRQDEVAFSSSEDEFTEGEFTDDDRESELTPLLAVQAGDLLLLQILLSAGTDVNQPLRFDMTLLMHAAEIGDLDVVNALLAAGADVNKLDNNDTTALMLASEHGHADIARVLLAAGSGIDQETWDGSTALMLSAREGHADIIALLIESGANLLKADQDNVTALMYAADSGRADVVIAMLGGSANQPDRPESGRDRSSALAIAARNGHLDVVNALIAARTDVDSPGNGIETALTNASINGHVEIVHALIAAGADLERTNRNLGPPLVFSTMSGQTSVVEALIRAGANVNALDGSGLTALMHAMQNAHGGIAALLLEAGTDISVCTNTGFTALGIASFYKHPHMARMLLPRIVIARDASRPMLPLPSFSQEDQLLPFVPHPLFEGHEGALTGIVAEYLSGDAQSLDRVARALTEYDQQACWQTHIDRIMSSAPKGSDAGDWLVMATRNNDADAVIALLSASFYSDQAREALNSISACRSSPHRNVLDPAALESAIEEGLQSRCHDDILAALLECRSRLLAGSASEQQWNRSWLSQCLFDTVRRHQTGEKFFAIDRLIAYGADVNMVHLHTSEVGPTVVYVACRRRQVSLLRHLLECNASPDGTDIFQNTAAHLAANMSNTAPDMIRMLHQAGANMHARNAWGLTPQHITHQVHAESPTMLDLLMDKESAVQE
jgi:uncharacterized protein